MRLIWTAPARADLYEIADYYGQFDDDLPLSLLRRVYEAPRILLDQPRLGSTTLWPGVRKWPVKRTPFLLLYVVHDDEIEVRRVMHNRSDWQTVKP